jgi:hypothetical protein
VGNLVGIAVESTLRGIVVFFDCQNVFMLLSGLLIDSVMLRSA